MGMEMIAAFFSGNGFLSLSILSLSSVLHVFVVFLWVFRGVEDGFFPERVAFDTFRLPCAVPLPSAPPPKRSRLCSCPVLFCSLLGSVRSRDFLLHVICRCVSPTPLPIFCLPPVNRNLSFPRL
eukprot:RCo009802